MNINDFLGVVAAAAATAAKSDQEDKGSETAKNNPNDLCSGQVYTFDAVEGGCRADLKSLKCAVGHCRVDITSS